MAKIDRGESIKDKEKEVYTYAKNALGWFKAGGFRTRSQILNTLSAEGLIHDKKLELHLEAVFVEIRKTLDQVRSIFPGFEPENFAEFALVPANQGTVAAIKSTWLRIVNDVRTIFQRQNGYVYIPDLRPQRQI